MPAGRPVTWTPEKRKEAIDKILAEISSTVKGIREICEDETLPDVATWYRWLFADAELRELYARAKEFQTEPIEDEMTAIADDGRNDWMMANAKDEEAAPYRLNGEHIQRSRLRIDTRKWLLAKLRPKKYGDFQRQEITGKDGEALSFRLLKADENL